MNRPRFKVGDMVIITKTGTIDWIKSVKVESQFCKYKLEISPECFCTESVLEHAVLPENWAVEVTDNIYDTPEIAEWFRNGWIGKGFISKRGFWHRSLNAYEDIRIITYKEFLKLVYKPYKDKMRKVTYPFNRKMAKDIYDVACTEWKTKILSITQDILGTLEDKGEIDHNLVEEMFCVADTEQRTILKKCFPDYNKDKNPMIMGDGYLRDVNKELFGNKNILTRGFGVTYGSLNRLTGRCLYVDKDYKVKLHDTGIGTLIEFEEK